MNNSPLFVFTYRHDGQNLSVVSGRLPELGDEVSIGDERYSVSYIHQEVAELSLAQQMTTGVAHISLTVATLANHRTDGEVDDA